MKWVVVPYFISLGWPFLRKSIDEQNDIQNTELKIHDGNQFVKGDVGGVKSIQSIEYYKYLRKYIHITDEKIHSFQCAYGV